MKEKLTKNPTLSAGQMKIRMRMEEATTSPHTDMMNKLLFERQKMLFFNFFAPGLSFYRADCSNGCFAIVL
jgi:hypothetical protein